MYKKKFNDHLFKVVKIREHSSPMEKLNILEKIFHTITNLNLDQESDSILLQIVYCILKL